VIKAFVGGQVVEPKHGESIVLTIDLVRQTILEEELARGVRESGATWGTAVAMDPHTGAILAMASYPSYDPNRAASFPEAARRLHAVTDRLEPGSTFKMVTAIAALEQGLVSMSDTIDTGAGWAVFGGRTMRDTRAYGRLSFEDVITYSSNVGTARVAERMDAGVLYQYARNLGYGQPTYVDIPGEVSGTLRKTHTWAGTDKTSMSIGYAVDATPLQIVTSYAAFANGGLLVHPHVVAERRDVTGRTVWTAPVDSVRRVFDPATAQALLPAFEKVVEEGTAKQARVPGLRVAGKTGTARKVEGGRYVGGAYRGSFVGFFPAEAPRVVMVVVMDEPRTSGYGGIVSAPVFQRTAHRWLATFPEIADRVAPREGLPDVHTVEIEDQVGRPASIAANRLAAGGLAVPWPESEMAGRTVRSQEPTGGDSAPPASRIRLAVDAAAEIPTTMPDLTGLTAREAVFWLTSVGVRPQVEGSGIVASQVPAAGSPLQEHAVVRLR
jgi:cell division protein FtsI (penicillin-binding protein 3)